MMKCSFLTLIFVFCNAVVASTYACKFHSESCFAKWKSTKWNEDIKIEPGVVPNTSRVSLTRSSPVNTQIEKDVKFFYRRVNDKGGISDEIELIPHCEGECLGEFKPNETLILFAHGFQSDPGVFKGAANALKTHRTDYNVILIDWSELAKGEYHSEGKNLVFYDRARYNLAAVGAYTGCMLKWLLAKELISVDKIHFIGHSLGGQMGNYVARIINHKCENRDIKLGRITGLDPAGPLFLVGDIAERLDPSDATFVDVIHTSIRLLGYSYPAGHVDFYVNNGVTQPMCGSDTLGQCSHEYAVTYFTETLHKNYERDFVGCNCAVQEWSGFANIIIFASECTCGKEKELMGYRTPASARGRYLVITNLQSPFGMKDPDFTAKSTNAFNTELLYDSHQKVSILAV